MNEGEEIVRDPLGQVFMACAVCGGPLRKKDFWEASLRLPEEGESAAEYCDAELIDALSHAACVASAARAAS